MRIDDFPDENKARQKLGLPVHQTPHKKKSQKSQYSENQIQHSPLDVVPVQDRSSDRPIKRNKPKYKIEKRKKKIELNDVQSSMKKEIDNIAESMTVANEMIDNADPSDSGTIELLVEVVGTLKTSESQLIETISNTNHNGLLDYAIKVNEDCQNTIRRFKQLQKGSRPSQFTPTHNIDFKKGYVEEEVKLQTSDDGYSDNDQPPAKIKHNEPRVDRKNEIKWQHQDPEPNRLEYQQRMDPDPERRHHKNYDSNVNRQVKLQKYELQSELEKRNADQQLEYMKNREIGYRDQNYYDSKKERAMKETQNIKNLPVDNYEPAPAKVKTKHKKPKEEAPKYDPYQVKSYGAPTTKLKEQIDSGNYLDPSLQESHNDDNFSGSVSSGKKKKKKKKKKTVTDNDSVISDQMNSSLKPSNARVSINIQTGLNNQGFGGHKNNELSQSQYSQNSSRMPDFGMPKQPPQDLMTPQKNSKRSDFDDPFSGIGFGGGLLEAPFQNQVNPTFGGGGLSLFHLDDNPNHINNQNQQNNNFDDPFGDAQFPNMGSNNSSSVRPTSTNQSQSNMSMGGSNRNIPSSQYNFESSRQVQKQDDFAFDDIDINLDDLNLNETPTPKIPPETKMKQNMSSGMPMGSNHSHSSMNSQNNGGMRQNMSPHMQNNMNIPNMGNRDMPGMGGQNMSNMGGKNMSNMGSQNMPNMNNQNMSQRAQKPPGIQSNKGPSPEMFNTSVPSYNGMGGNNMIKQNLANDDPFADMFPTGGSAAKSNTNQNMMSYNNSQMSAEPQVINRGGPASYVNPNNFNTVVPNQNNYGMNNGPGFGSMGNFGTSSPPIQTQGFGFQGPSNDNPHSNNMIVPVDPFAGANMGGYNGGAFAGGFNTISAKPKRKNPFAKNNIPDAGGFQTNFGGGGFNQPTNNYSDLFNQSSSSHNSNMGYNNTPNPNMFATTMNPNSGSMGLGMFSQTQTNQQNNNGMSGGQNTNFDDLFS
jgi:hypothetical protein